MRSLSRGSSKEKETSSDPGVKEKTSLNKESTGESSSSVPVDASNYTSEDCSDLEADIEVLISNLPQNTVTLNYTS